MKELKENHPLSVKLNQLLDYMDTLGIRIEANRYGCLYITDTENDVSARYYDVELKYQGSLPSKMEHRLIKMEE